MKRRRQPVIASNTTRFGHTEPQRQDTFRFPNPGGKHCGRQSTQPHAPGRQTGTMHKRLCPNHGTNKTGQSPNRHDGGSNPPLPMRNGPSDSRQHVHQPLCRSFHRWHVGHHPHSRREQCPFPCCDLHDLLAHPLE